MSLSLDAYLARIGYEGSLEPNLDTLCAVQSHHAQSIPYEAIDVFLQSPVDQDLERIFEKLVRQNRGGWCYEMNGLMGWALGEMGFDVTRLCGGVMRAFRGDEVMGNHLILRVDLDDIYIADVGLGDANLQPLLLCAGKQRQGFRSFVLESLEEDLWRCHNNEGALPPNYDFSVAPADEDRLARVGQDLQDDADSMFRQNLTCQMMTEESTKVLIGRVFSQERGREDRRLLGSEDELLSTLESAFGIVLSDTSGLWDRVVARHEDLFGPGDDGGVEFFPAQPPEPD